MHNIETAFIERCILTLQKGLERLNTTNEQELEYDLYRSACIKEFEIILEQSANLLKKCLKLYFHSPRAVDRLYFKDIFRHAAKHDIISMEESERWLTYRDMRNSTSHDYGKAFATTTLKILPQFIIDAEHLVQGIQKHDAS
ncbi:HI0074 family nucleotidyltransferase substrate-binding subunit [Candidatus Albibeggiatoa sp. nov. BB20]|uniref:HI0074 family nucleotidyltransferase substrate-binding subunit n=1 Tax=Candidatus Albibeggiatoa sp. nov. BB20 TaxID=3162723 RepID=UPI0033655246